MTATVVVKNIDKEGKTWLFGNPRNSLGGLEDHHIKLWGECHPDFTTHVIGAPHGAKICVRKPQPDLPPSQDLYKRNGYHRASVNLYDERADYPTQEWNPQFYSDRRVPYEQELLYRDYIHIPVNFSGTGIKPLHTPHQLRDSAKPYFEYGYSYNPLYRESEIDGTRLPSTWKDTRPPYKYDLTKLHQSYPIWKEEHKYMGHPQNDQDIKQFKRIV